MGSSRPTAISTVVVALVVALVVAACGSGEPSGDAADPAPAAADAESGSPDTTVPAAAGSVTPPGTGTDATGTGGNPAGDDDAPGEAGDPATTDPTAGATAPTTAPAAPTAPTAPADATTDAIVGGVRPDDGCSPDNSPTPTDVAPGPPPTLAVSAESADDPLPALAVRRVNCNGGWVDLRDELPAGTPLLVWFWAPH